MGWIENLKNHLLWKNKFRNRLRLTTTFYQYPQLPNLVYFLPYRQIFKRFSHFSNTNHCKKFSLAFFLLEWKKKENSFCSSFRYRSRFLYKIYTNKKFNVNFPVFPLFSIPFKFSFDSFHFPFQTHVRNTRTHTQTKGKKFLFFVSFFFFSPVSFVRPFLLVGT